VSITLPVVPKILRTRTPTFPQFEFEWHEVTGKVYVVETPKERSNTANGVAIAEHVSTHAGFLGAVQTYLRGYRKGKSDENIGTR
jgi:hypothetical protein